jgi:uncharacterized membrane protein
MVVAGIRARRILDTLASVETRGSVWIKAPVGVVFGVISTPERLPEWNQTVSRAWRSSEGPVAVGARATAEGELLGQRMVSETEVVELVQDQLFATRGIKGPRLNTRFALTEENGGVRVDARVEGSLPGGPLVEAMAAGFVKGEFERSLQRLKAVCEGAVTG